VTKLNNKSTINRISLFLNVLLVVSTVMLITGTPLIEPFFYGRLMEAIISSDYAEKVNKNSYYSTIFKYKHIKGKSIHNATVDFQIINTGSMINLYEPFFKTLWSKNNIKQEKDDRHLRLEIPEIRPNDEFDIRLYSKVKADIKSTIVMRDGVLVNQEVEVIRNPVFWIILLIISFFAFCSAIWYWTIHKLHLEKERIIGERNALQQIVLSKDRLTSKGE